MANKVAITKAKKGDTVMLCMFTGMRVGPKEVIACDKDTVTISRNEKGNVTFSRKTGKQLDPMPKNARFAGFITEDDGTYTHPTRKTKKTKNSKTKVKPPKAKPIRAAQDDDEDETPAPKKATKKKAAPKKKAEPQPEPEEKDEDEEWDDDDFEEVE